jgi:hypothetical protein
VPALGCETLLAVLTIDAELLSPPTHSKVTDMLGVFLFCLFFTFLSLLTRFPTRQTGGYWWVKIITETPQCIYYFGPFDHAREAELTQKGYIEDLEQEGAEGISVLILQDQPKTLTICEDD